MIFFDELNKVLDQSEARYQRSKDDFFEMRALDEEDRERGAFLRQQFEKMSAEQEEFERSISFPEFTLEDGTVLIYSSQKTCFGCGSPISEYALFCEYCRLEL